jgi:hypothetical protein
MKGEKKSMASGLKSRLKNVYNNTLGEVLQYKNKPCESLPVDDKLYNTHKIAMLVKYVLISQFIQTDLAPLSLFLIAPTESNKTRILLLFKNFPHVKTIENLSAKPLNDLIAKQEHRQTIFEIIILDFIRTLQQKGKVADAVIGTLLNLTEEGSQESLFYGQEYKLKRRIQMGILTGITPPLFKKHFAKWNENGAMTRWLFCSYHYSQDTVNTVKTFISKNLPYMVDDIIVKVKQYGKKEILINPDISSAIRLLSDQVEEQLKTFYVIRMHGKTATKIYLDMQGFRLQKMLRLLAQCIAYDRGHFDGVNYQDLEELKGICDLIRLPDNPKEI